MSAVFHEGEITAIIGPNGSGKSTFLKTIAGLTNLYSGEIDFDGHSLKGLPPHEIARRGIVYIPQRDNVYGSLTIKENFRMSSYIFKGKTQEKIQMAIKEFPILAERLNQKAETLSGGLRQILAIASALIREPKIILFDEPTASLAPNMAQQVFDEIVRLRKDKDIAVVVVEQNAYKALQAAEKAYLFVAGKVAFEGTTSEFLSNPQLSSLYLGLEKKI
jgi:branched-chain amino acid transport system ATP-binding protein